MRSACALAFFRAVFGAVCILGGYATADSAPAPSGGDRQALIQIGRPRHVPSALDSVPHPWPGVALSLSAVGAALPIAIATRPHSNDSYRAFFVGAVVAEVFTPAAGHLYAGLNRRAAAGILVRAVGGGIVVAGLAPGGSSEDLTPGDIAALFGATMVAISALVDVVTVPSDVERRNAEWLRAHAAVGLRALPDGRAPALAVTMRF